MTSGKLKSALRMVDGDELGAVLRLDNEIDGETVCDLLKGKHPEAASIKPGSVLVPDGVTQLPHPILLAAITRDNIRRFALKVEGAAGPSGVDADIWQRMLTSFGKASGGLCDAIATCAIRIARFATTYIDPVKLEAYTAWKAYSSDKNLGLRPIGKGEIMRRIIGKSINIMGVIGSKIKEVASYSQYVSIPLCAAFEAAVHVTFNRLNSGCCLQNICLQYCSTTLHVLS
eukprot:scpid101616/ scgid21259/ 